MEKGVDFLHSLLSYHSTVVAPMSGNISSYVLISSEGGYRLCLNWIAYYAPDNLHSF